MITRINVIDEVFYGVSREGDPNDTWDRDSTYEDHNVTGIRVVEGYSDLEVGFTPEPNKDYWLLYGIYSTGDSFGTDDGRISYVDLYEDRGVAEENAKRLRKHNEGNEDCYSCKLIHESGKEYQFHVPWKGYFERLSYLEVKAVRIGGSRF